MPNFDENVVIRNDQSDPTIHLSNDNGNVRAGGNGTDGDLALYSAQVEPHWAHWDARVWLDAQTGNGLLGGSGVDGDLMLFPDDASLPRNAKSADEATVWLDGGYGNVMAGGNNKNGALALFRADQEVNSPFARAEIVANAASGTVAIRNSAYVVEFSSAEGNISPGTLVSINESGLVEAASETIKRYHFPNENYTQVPNDHVVGIVASQPGVTLDHDGDPEIARVPVAVAGKTVCKVTKSRIEPGDTLIPAGNGYAKKGRASGAIIGKALGKNYTKTYVGEPGGGHHYELEWVSAIPILVTLM